MRVWPGRQHQRNAGTGKALAAKEGYEIAFSIPSFELWFLLHFQSQTVPLENCDAVIWLLK